MLLHKEIIMKYYSVNKKKQKEVYKNYIKRAIWQCGNFVKFSYVFEKILLLTAVVLGIINIVNVVFFSHEPLYLFFLIMTIGFPFGISLIFKAVYKNWILKDFIVRKNEKLGLDGNKIEYSYNLKYMGNLITFVIPLTGNCKIEYDSQLKKYSVTGNIKYTSTDEENHSTVQMVTSIDFLDVFDAPLFNYLQR